MLEAGVGSAMMIASELQKAFKYNGYYTTGREKIYPLVVCYLERLVEEGKVILVFNHGIDDRIYANEVSNV